MVCASSIVKNHNSEVVDIDANVVCALVCVSTGS